jgi:hypothetical protein
MLSLLLEMSGHATETTRTPTINTTAIARAAT